MGCGGCQEGNSLQPAALAPHNSNNFWETPALPTYTHPYHPNSHWLPWSGLCIGYWRVMEPRLRPLQNFSLWAMVAVLASKRSKTSLPSLTKTSDPRHWGMPKQTLPPPPPAAAAFYETSNSRTVAVETCFVSRQEKGRDQYGLRLGKKNDQFCRVTKGDGISGPWPPGTRCLVPTSVQAPRGKDQQERGSSESLWASTGFLTLAHWHPAFIPPDCWSLTFCLVLRSLKKGQEASNRRHACIRHGVSKAAHATSMRIYCVWR